MEERQAVLVTGGAGYVGSHTCLQLYQEGFLPITYDNLSTGHRYSVQWGPFIHGDIQDIDNLNLALATYKPIAIFHFAADALVGESVVNPGKYYGNNVAGTNTLLQAAVQNKIKYFIFSSTCATYGNPEEIPISENHTQKPINPYGRSKLMVEQMLEDYSRAYDFTYSSLRYFNAAGADQMSRIGEDRDYETHLIPLTLQAALDSSKKISIYGDDFLTEDGTAIRDYIHVNDLAKAHISAMRWLKREKKNLILNLGTGKGFSVKEIIETAEKICQKNIRKEVVTRRAGDPAILIADNYKAKEILQWIPQESDIETIIDSAWRWHQKHHEQASSLSAYE